ncbi:MAG: magnesium-dependent phosphatase-1 [Bacteroidales bacterium]|nr:magnesium-dependent phosphatase-1 [Bacteroidales bacterium]HOK98814.1 magnesium-dependent phosphatase-1 [Bacteroidales bacterium]HPO65356.1 magnesium-dependent phosphatase-1 [Bacteroidales bacterium]
MAKQLFIFDLDFTLWDAGGLWCDCTTPPYRRINGFVKDAENRIIQLYPDVWEIIHLLKRHGRKIAVASRTEQPAWARQILDLMDLRQWFDYEEIFPDRKIYHLQNIHRQSGIPFNQMVFFDDEQRNIIDVTTLGVTSEWVQNGITRSLVAKYL